ncbi:MAG: arsenate reductase ArsC [Actinomycetota bacterium]
MNVTDPLASAPLELRPLIRSVAERLRVEFDGVFATQTIQRFMADSYEALSGARVKGFVPLFVERYTRQRLSALARVEGKATADKPMVVFLCVHNAGRSQMAAGWMQHLAGDAADVYSGGSDPVSEVNPAAVASMAEVGIDISSGFPKPWTDEIVRAADVIVTMGCGDACPIFPGKRYLDWEIPDPAGLPVEDVRPIRDEIGERVRGIMADLRIPPRS